MNDTERAALLLHDQRQSIDRLDAILVWTLAERFKHTERVSVMKGEHNLPSADLEREVWQIERLERMAKEAGLDPVFARKFLDFIIKEVIRHHDLFQK